MTKLRIPARTVPAWAAAVAAAVVACSGGPPGAHPGVTPTVTEPAPTVATTVTATATPRTTTPARSASATTGTTARPTDTWTWHGARLYFLRSDTTLVPVYRPVHVRNSAVATAAMTALLQGATPAERSAGAGTAIPPGTRLLGLSIHAGIAVVDLTGTFAAGGGSASMSGRVAQVVYTLTQFPTVTGVTFRLDGRPLTVLGGEGLLLDRPVTRASAASLLPPIFVDSPARGEHVSGPVRVRGLADVFEGQFLVEVRDAYGKVLVRRSATGGAGQHRAFAVTLPFQVVESAPGRIVAYDLSAKDGSVVDMFAVPVTLNAPSALPDGRYAARITALSAATRRATVDLVQFFTGPDAARAAAEDRASEVPPPNDYWIRDVSSDVRRLQLSKDAVVTVNTLAAGETGSAVRNVRVTPARLATYPGLSGALFWVTLHHGQVTRIAEQYLP